MAWCCYRAAAAVVLLSAMVLAGHGCCSAGKAGAPSGVPLENTYWRLAELQGKEVLAPDGRKEAHLTLLPGEKKVQGFGGCNGFFGSYELEGDRLSFGPVGSTRMACPDTGDMEIAFFQVLESATTFEIGGRILDLMGPEGSLARFQAGSPRAE